MPSEFDESEFIDTDLQAAQRAQSPTPEGTTPGVAPTGTNRPPTREELHVKVNEAQQKLAQLRHAQEELERERSGLEEARRRQTEFHTGREEMVHHLTHGLALLEESEFAARRDAKQMAKSLSELRDALTKLQSIQDDSWTQDNWNVELTRALTTIENARMEWNTARLKWPFLDGNTVPGAPGSTPAPANPLLTIKDWPQLCRLGLALTWPLALLGVLILLAIWFRR